MGDHLVGVSHCCHHPSHVQNLPRLTSTRVPVDATSATIDSYVREHLEENSALYDLDMQALHDAAPDVIVSQTLCDVCAVSTGDVLAALRSLPSRPVLVDLKPSTLADVLEDCLRVGDAMGRGEAAHQLVAALRRRLDEIAMRTARIEATAKPRVVFLEWLDPPFNGGHWNPEIVERAGGIDMLGTHGQASTTITWEAVAAADPDVLFVACCGLPVQRALSDLRSIAQRPEWAELRAVKAGRVFVANGNDYFACPGPRLVDSLEIIAHALHPEIHPDLHPTSRATVAG